CDFHAVQVCSECGEPVTARDVEARPGPGAG
ncbi:MAG TPA: transcriptional regulator, partial [Phenylobacterium sp.]|nr:transcriptional regulator [Phenylobacterium sp.]